MDITVRGVAMKFNIKYILATVVFCLTLVAGIGSNVMAMAQDGNPVHDSHSIDDPSRGNIREFKDNYIPKEYYPMPEFMVFVDLGILILLVVLGLYFVMKRKSGRPMNILMIVTFVYLAFIRGGCICPAGVITNTVMGIINPAMVGLATLIVFLVPLVAALVSGRVFCSAGCPLGAVQHIGKKKNDRKYIKIPTKLNNILKVLPIVVLGLTIYAGATGACYLVCELDPYKAIFHTGQAWFEQGLAFIIGQPMESKILLGAGVGTWIYLMIILAIGYWIPRPFCRFICPYGVLLGVISIFAIKRRSIHGDNCVHCGLCQKVCPTQAITIDRKTKYSYVSNYDCIQCNKCNETCKKDAII
ncbi:4Fe-4S dicluster domain-containing protein [Puteibacter caeruleilacunae]|nr:4Fe-4S dicluster domain-containing protein [Puteibacter caeruleilacunae]